MPLPYTDDEKTRLMHQVFSLFTRYGFDGISMDEVVARIKISKATLYKFFKSKEDIVRDMVKEAATHLNAVQFSADKGIDSVLETMSALYFKAILVAAYSSSKFIEDLESKYPDIYNEYISTMDSVQSRFTDFYESAVREGYFKKVSIGLISTQCKMMMPTMIKSDHLISQNTTLPDVIVEYYKLLLYQILSEEYMAVTAQESIYSFVDELVEVLKSNFMVDEKLT